MLQVILLYAALSVCLCAYIVPNSEIQALQDLYDATGGESWAWQYPLSKYGQIWNFTAQPVTPCNHWQGITCHVAEDNLTATVDTLRLKYYNLKGKLTATLSQLVNASVFDFDYNYLHGTIPATFNNMTYLQQLRLSYNSLSGTIPAVFFTTACNLSYLSLTENQITGTIPDLTTGHSQALEEFFLNDNHLSGTIPSRIDQYSNLKVLFIGNNELHGTVPDTLYNLKKVNRMAINNNYLVGTISDAISGLEEIFYLYMHQNSFEGTIPASVGDLHRAVFITLFENFLTGPMPSTLGNMKVLRSFSADTNFLSGTLPSELGDCPILEELNVYSNLFTGPLPGSLSQLRRLQLVLVQSNHFTGNPAVAFNATAQKLMRSIDLSINKFTGSIPVTAFGSELLSFSAFQTCFSGRIPEEICASSKLESLVLDGLTSQCAKPVWPLIPGSPTTVTEVIGGIPECIWSALPNLTTLHLSSNGLTGTIPSLASYGNLTDLDLSFNLLSGPVPEVLQGWHKLQVLNLKSNRFCGDITGTGQLHFAYHDGEPGTELKLSENRFSGIIPLALQSATQIDVVAGNMFSCRFGHYPPYNDPNGDTYVCGSNLLYISMATLAAALGVVAIAVGVAFAVAYGLVKRLEMPTSSDPNGNSSGEPTFAEVYARMLVVFSSAAGAAALYNKVASAAGERYLHAKGLVVRMVGWKRHVDSLIAVEDRRHDRTMQLGAALKEALLSNQEGAEGSALHQLQSTDIAQLKSANVPNLVQFLKSMRLLRNTVIVVFCAQLVMTLPAFPILKYYRGTYLFQYGWYISGALMSGYQPCVAIILIWFISLSLVLYAIVRYIPSRKALKYRTALQARAYELLVLWRRLENGSMGQDAATIKELAATEVPVEIERPSYTVGTVFAVLSRAVTINREEQAVQQRMPSIQMTMTTSFARQLNNALSKPSLTAVQAPDDSVAENADRSHTTTNADSVSSTAPQKESARTWVDRLKSYLRQSVAISFAAVLFDIIVVLSIKGLFLYALNSNKTSFAVKIAIELALSCTDLVWSVMFVPTMITRLPKMKPAGKMILKIALLYFNSILAPCIATAVTEEDCFNGMFVKHSAVNELFQFSFCALFDPTDVTHCLRGATWETTIKYTPPFLYNFNCYSTVITSYSPVFLFSYCILSLALPVASMYITTLTKRRWFRGVVPGIFWLDGTSSSSTAQSTDQRAGTRATESTEIVGAAAAESTLHPLHKGKNSSNSSGRKGLPQVDSSASLASQLTESSAGEQSTPPGNSDEGNGKQRRGRAKVFLFFPGFILASAIHHLLVLITFGLMLPVLGLAIVVVAVITTCTWELVIGRYLAQSPNCNPQQWLSAEAAMTDSPSQEDSERRSPSSSSHNTAALTVTPTEEDCSGGLDVLCVHVACCARKCKWLIAYGSAAVFAFAVLDMASDTEFVRVAVWAPITVLVLPLPLLAALKWWAVGTADQNAYEETCAQQARAETMIMMRGTVVNEDFGHTGGEMGKYQASRNRFSHYDSGGDAV